MAAGEGCCDETFAAEVRGKAAKAREKWKVAEAVGGEPVVGDGFS